MRDLQMTFRVYRRRYKLPAPVAYRLARYIRMERLTINEGWMRYGRGELYWIVIIPPVVYPALSRYRIFCKDLILKGYEV